MYNQDWLSEERQRYTNIYYILKALAIKHMKEEFEPGIEMITSNCLFRPIATQFSLPKPLIAKILLRKSGGIIKEEKAEELRGCVEGKGTK